MIKSIRSKLIVLSLSLILITVIPVIISVNVLINNYVNRTHLKNVSQQINTIDQLVQVFYDDLDRNIDMYATMPLVKEASGKITKYLESKDEEMTPYENGGVEQTLYESFVHYAKTHPGTSYVYMADEEGGYLVWPCENDRVTNYDPRTRSWYKTGQGSQGKIVRTNPYTSLLTGEAIVSNLRSFTDNEGKVRGVLGIDVSSSKLVEIMNNIKIGTTGYAIMLHKTGLIVADPKKPENNLKQLKDIGIQGMETILENDTASFGVVIDGLEYQVNSFQSSTTDWVIATLIESSELREASSSIRNLILGISMVLLAVVVVFTYFASGRFVKPINLMVTSLKDISQGDLTTRLPADSRDEIGEMALWFNNFVEKLQAIVKSIAANSGELGDSSSSLLAIAGKVSTGAESMSDKSAAVASAADEMSSNIAFVASSAKESSTNIGMVSAAAEEMTATINEIAGNMERTRITSNDAVSRASVAAEKIDQLEQAARQIGNVVDTINDISEQTNLLALNATIEASRAGEAGKGFGVVAGEIKELARQTAEATLEIKDNIQGIQSFTKETVAEIQEVSGGISSVNEMIDTVAAAVEEQSVTTREIAGNVGQAAQGLQEITNNLTHTSGVAQEIAGDITDVSRTASDMSERSMEIDNSADGLSKLSDSLNDTVAHFKV